jgi:hypothetical protein
LNHLSKANPGSSGKGPLRIRRFVPRYLDPASRLGEVLFGLIMVLTMTLTAGLTIAEGKEGFFPANEREQARSWLAA